MAKTRVLGVEKVLKNINKVFDSSIKQERFLNSVKDFVVLRIQAETRKGKDLSRGGKHQPDLSEGTIGIREKIKSGKWIVRPKLGKPFFKFNFSNLTLSGQLLESLEGRVLARRGQIEVTVGDARTEVDIVVKKTGKVVEFQNSKPLTSNRALVRDLAKRGRTFLGFDKKGVMRIRKMVLDEIRRSISRLNFD